MPMDYNFTLKTIGTFRFWCQKVLPAVYDDSLSYYELLCKVVEYLNDAIDELNVHSDAITELQEIITQIQEEFDDFKDSGFYDYYAEQLEAWIEKNMPWIIGKYIRMVFFGLTLDGHFVAYIPAGNGWDDISFDTGAVYGSDEYGRLILRYYVDGEPLEVRQ